jgi:tryptophan synthase alpha chain
MLESYLRRRMEEKEILLMTHIVLGYPNFEASMAIVAAMVGAGVDLMELQIPFSEPMADGPVILKANQASLAGGTTVARCIDFAGTAAARFPIPFLFMTYTNILFKYGMDRFAGAMADAGLAGAIVPDLPPEEGDAYLPAMKQRDLAPIFVLAPTTTDARMHTLVSSGAGFVYCMARKGVTGKETAFSDDLADYLSRCRKATDLPLALGFGVKEKRDIDFLKGKVEIAVIGSETIRLIDRDGVGAVGDFIRNLR